CADLADWALTQAGAKSFKELGPTGPKDKYVWGAKIKIDEVQAGDILQIGHYKYKTETKHGKMPPETHLGELHHHTAIVSDIMDPKTGAIPVLDQHWVRAAHAQHGQWLVQEWVLYTRNVPEA